MAAASTTMINLFQMLPTFEVICLLFMLFDGTECKPGPAAAELVAQLQRIAMTLLPSKKTRFEPTG